MAWPEKILEKILDNPDFLTPQEKALLEKVDLLVDSDYGFEQNSFYGVDLKDVDLNKLIVYGSSLDPDNEKGTVKKLYDLIKKLTGCKNDGVVVFDEDLFDKKGINYIVEKQPHNHFESCTKEILNDVHEISRKK